MDTFDAINQRRSVKSFDKNYKMTKDEIDKLLELAILSPTSYNIQNWRFVTVTDQTIKDKLSEIADYGGVANMANGGIVRILKK